MCRALIRFQHRSACPPFRLFWGPRIRPSTGKQSKREDHVGNRHYRSAGCAGRADRHGNRLGHRQYRVHRDPHGKAAQKATAKGPFLGAGHGHADAGPPLTVAVLDPAADRTHLFTGPAGAPAHLGRGGVWCYPGRSRGDFHPGYDLVCRRPVSDRQKRARDPCQTGGEPGRAPGCGHGYLW